MTNKNTVLGARIVAGMKNGPTWKDIPPEAEESWKLYLRQAPQVLSPFLDWPCSLSNFMQARMEWVSFLLRETAFRKVYQRGPHLVSALANFHEQLEKLEEFAHTPKDKQTPVAIEHFLQDVFHLTSESFFTLCQKNIPLREILITKPWVILTI